MDVEQIRSRSQTEVATSVAPSGLVLREHAARVVQNTPLVAEVQTPGYPLQGNSSGVISRQRLTQTKTDINERIWPVKKHWGDANWDEKWSLYWVPTAFSNKRSTQCDPRLMNFLERLLAEVHQESKTRQFTFFDSQMLHPFLLKRFVLDAMEYFPIGANGFRPEAGPCRLPEYEDMNALNPHKTFSLIKEKDQNFSMGDLFPSSPPMLYFLPTGHEKARRELTGRGAYTLFVSKLKQSEFFDKTKQMLKKNTTDEVMLRLPMTVPLLSSASFTRSLRPDLEQMFSLFELYISESPRDKGVVIAASRCLDEQIEEFVNASRLNASGLRDRLSMISPRRKEGSN